MKYQISILLLTVLSFGGCRKFIEVPSPKTETDISTVFGDDVNAKAAMLGAYQLMPNMGSQISLYAGLAADEYYRDQIQSDRQFYENGLLSDNVITRDFWVEPYRCIYISNTVLEGIRQSTAVSASLKLSLEGEAKFIRAFHHFNIVNMFGDIAYISGTDYRVNNVAVRMPAGEVYAAIVNDLKDAKALLPDDYPTAGRARVNKWAAAALLARAYLYSRDWANAEAQATEVIDERSRYQLEADLSKVFLKTSREAIWQLVPYSYMSYTMEGTTFINTASDTYGVIPDSIVETFEPGDRRVENWIKRIDYGTVAWYYPFKYKENYENGTNSEYSTVLRLAEQYLIRAEARAMQGKLTGPNSAASDIDSIRIRAGLLPTTAATQPQLLAAIEQERRWELLMEWGHRWFDLKRTKRADAVLGAIKPGWTGNDTLFPIPRQEVLANPNIKQNKGYQ